MLLRFSCENFRCFSDPCVLEMTASADNRHPDHLRASSRIGAEPVLSLAGIYGPNGHGKTKLIEGLHLVEMLVLGMSEEAMRQVVPFRLKKTLRDKPSKFVVWFRNENVDYEYGIILDNKKIHQEWLFETEKRKETLLFSRKIKPSHEEYTYEFGSKLRRSSSPTKTVSMEDYLKVIGTGTDKSTTFLFEAREKRVTRLNRAFDWFQNKLMVINAEASYAPLLMRSINESSFLKEISNSIKSSGTGIKSIAVKNEIIEKSAALATLDGVDGDIFKHLESLEEDEYLSVSGNDGLEMSVRDLGDKLEVHRLSTMHSADDGEQEFSLSDESSGTRRLFDLYPMFHIAAERDAVFVVDELDRKLHPLLSYELIQKFANLGKGQLIFTTHTTHLLDLDLLRRDEVWLLQKDKDGASELYSLSDFKIRPDLDIRKGYLQGRFGAVPFFGSVRDLGWCADEA